jgi:hypothetical protein
VLGIPLAAEVSSETRPVAPGGLASHYAPRALVRLNADAIRTGEAALLFGGVRPAGLQDAAAMLDLSPAGDLAEAAAHLFGYLRRLDATSATTRRALPQLSRTHNIASLNALYQMLCPGQCGRRSSSGRDKDLFTTPGHAPHQPLPRHA